MAAPAVQAKDPTPVRLQLLWVHQAQFAGIYMAADAGLYRQAGLDVQIVPGGPGISPLGALADGKCDFALSWLAPAVEARAQGMKIKQLAQVVQRSGMLLVALAESDIQEVADMAGLRVGLWDDYFALAPIGLFLQHGIVVRQVVQNVSIAPLLSHAVDVASAMRYNEYHQLYQAGVDPDELVVFDLAEMGFNFPEDGIYTSEKCWREHPDICRALTQASLDGWRLAREQPERALDAVMKRVDGSRLASNRPHQAWMLKIISELVSSGVTRQTMGRLDPEAYNSLLSTLTAQGMLRSQPALADFCVPAWRRQP
jgi:NitT/TauT family transport system substrate-binding protein